MKNLFILLCVSMPMLLVAEVYSDPYGYWYTDLSSQERYELHQLLDEYYNDYLNGTIRQAETFDELPLEDKCYSGYPEQSRIVVD